VAVEEVMDSNEAHEKALDLLGIRDPFTRIVVADLLRDMKPGSGMPAPGSPEEARLAELGRLVANGS